MIKLELVAGVIGFALWVYCLVDAIGTPPQRVEHLPKVAWIVLVLLFPFVGSIAWLALGRDRGARPLTRSQGAAPGFPEYERPGRMAAGDAGRDEEFLRQVRARAEEQRRRHELARREEAAREEAERQRLRAAREAREQGRSGSADGPGAPAGG